jgi:hypothetical protein
LQRSETPKEDGWKNLPPTLSQFVKTPITNHRTWLEGKPLEGAIYWGRDLTETFIVRFFLITHILTDHFLIQAKSAGKIPLRPKMGSLPLECCSSENREKQL